MAVDLFDKVQRILKGTRKRRRPPRRSRAHVYLLSGLMRCGKCGAAMVPACAYGRNGTRYHYYQCTKRNRVGKAACDAKMVRARAAE